jgi:hypothetical protein
MTEFKTDRMNSQEDQVHFRIPLWLRITVAVILAAALIAVLFTGGKMILDIWAQSSGIQS